MSSLARLTAFVAAAAITATLALGVVAQDVDPAIAAASPEELVAMRKAAMKEDGGILRGAGSLTGADAVAAADKLIHNYTLLPAMFPEGSIVGDSESLPAIWENLETFNGIFAKGLKGAQDMKAAAETGDAAAYGAALQVIGGTCGECHQQFRS